MTKGNQKQAKNIFTIYIEHIEAWYIATDFINFDVLIKKTFTIVYVERYVRGRENKCVLMNVYVLKCIWKQQKLNKAIKCKKRVFLAFCWRIFVVLNCLFCTWGICFCFLKFLYFRSMFCRESQCRLSWNVDIFSKKRAESLSCRNEKLVKPKIKIKKIYIYIY